jgi:hypothetical protein
MARVRRSARLPNFIVIGAMKSGTTSLFHYLQAHPQAHMSPLKEVEFFVEEKNWRRGFDWYRAQFAGARPETIAIGEASTAYTKYPEFKGVPERIAQHLPDVRLIYIVRDPIERIRSHYQHRVQSGAEREPLERAVLEDDRYVNCSRYAMQIERYLPHFPREHVLLVTSERLRSSRAETLRSVYGFLGIDPTFVSDVIDQEFYRSEERAAYPPIAWWLRRTVKRYVPAGKRLKEMIDLVAPASLRWCSDRRHETDRPSSTFAIPDPVRARLAERLADDVARLRTRMPADFDGWGIADASDEVMTSIPRPPGSVPIGERPRL